MAYPATVSLAQHRFNSAPFVDTAFQMQRPISPSEFLTVRAEMQDVRQAITKSAARYHRIVSDVVAKGHLRLTLCTNSGDLVRAKVYRRFYGDSADRAKFDGALWQYVGAWHYGLSAQRGWLFPHDVPLHSVVKYEQIDAPNTFAGRKSAVDATSMSHGFGNLPGTEDQKLTAEQEASQPNVGKRNADKFIGARMGVLADQVMGGGKASDRNFDSQSKVSSQQWSNAVRAAKHRGKRRDKR
jgi:hypothetical protein